MKIKDTKRLAANLMLALMFLEVLAPGIAAKINPEIQKPVSAFYTIVFVSAMLVYAISGNQLKEVIKSDTYKEIKVYVIIALMLGLLWVLISNLVYFALP